jgi:hypothetical protein
VTTETPEERWRGDRNRRVGSVVRLVLGAALVIVGVLAAGCSSSIIGPASTTPPVPQSAGKSDSTTTSVPITGEVAVAFPVVACTTSSGAPLPAGGWSPTILLAPIPTSLVGKVQFYSDGVHTVLGPSGWSCSQEAATQGASGLVVSPPGTNNPPVAVIPAAGTEGVFAIFDNTGMPQGISLVCPYFIIPSWQKTEAHCSGLKPVGEQTSTPTPDVVAVTDPGGVAGTLEGSGGDHPVTGAVIFPQSKPAVANGSRVNVAVESCSLVASSLCPTIISDFEVREFPVPVPTYSSSYPGAPSNQ